MGVLSKIHRYREAGEQANVNNVDRFGEPVRSLFTSTKILTLRHHIDVTDENEQVVYQASTKIVTLHDTTDITDAEGKAVAHIEKKLFSLHQRHLITMADGTYFEMSNELLHIVKDITNVEGLGLQIRGNILGLNFEIYDREERIVALIGQKMLSMHDKYCLDIYQPEYEQVAVTILVTVQHMMRDRAAASSASSSSS